MVRGKIAIVPLMLLMLAVAAPTMAAGKKSKAAKAPADPVAKLFATVPGATLTDKQSEAVQKLRDEYEQKLRDAMEKVKSSKDDKEKREAAAEARQLREKIHQEMANILNTSGDDSSKTNIAKPQAQQSRQSNMQKANKLNKAHRMGLL